MACWLFGFNPSVYPWQDIDYAEACAATRLGKLWHETWTCCSTKPEIGDRFYMILQGMGEMNGIMAAGRIASKAYFQPSWLDPSRIKRVIDIDFDFILDYREEMPLPIRILRGAYPVQCWSPRASGIRIRPECVNEINDLWREYLKESRFRKVIE